MAVGLRGSLSSPGTSASPHVSPGSCDEAGPLEVVVLEVLSSLPYCPTDGVETWTGWSPKLAFSSFLRSDIVGEAQSAWCY